MNAHSLGTIWRLGVKELWSLWRDPVMLVLIAFSFTVSVYTAATAVPETLHHVPIAIVDEDHSPLSRQIAGAFPERRQHPRENVVVGDRPIRIHLHRGLDDFTGTRIYI